MSFNGCRVGDVANYVGLNLWLACGAVSPTSAWFPGTASGAQTERVQLRKAGATLSAGDVLVVTRLTAWRDRLGIFSYPRHHR
jgi:hypothetical protein